ncbi:transposase [Methylocystis sp. WRRC1]|uniref:transposase n=1 Tax=Methylocystis sp. WRRC1 TaxID=1732014 RepID=UPI001D15E1CA|nr:transposase [Methylocystis sp. WRRC1]MCC3244573.1 transposase [Methylocystis sp. WRRC1]
MTETPQYLAPHSVAPSFTLCVRLMLTAILLAYDPPAQPLRGDSVARSLGSLVEACVQGLVADAVLVGAPERGFGRIADDAGCALVETSRPDEGLAQALTLARHDDVLLMLAGYAVERGFIDEVQDNFAYGDHKRPLVLRAAPNSLLTRVAPQLAAPVGIIARRSDLRGAASSDLARLTKKMAGVDLTTRARRIF